MQLFLGLERFLGKYRLRIECPKGSYIEGCGCHLRSLSQDAPEYMS